VTLASVKTLKLSGVATNGTGSATKEGGIQGFCLNASLITFLRPANKMLILGLAGGANLAYEDHFPVNKGFFHDAAAVLLDSGNIVAAIEEERLNRIKHTNKAPSSAMRFCLDSMGLSPNDVDKVAVYGTEAYFNNFFKQYHVDHPVFQFLSARESLHRIIRAEFGSDINDDKFNFVHHHIAHAMSAYALSGFSNSLVVTIDGQGDGVSGMVFDGQGSNLSRLHTIPTTKSLGWFYDDAIRFIGFGEFEEYKVMGLAPYGDAARYRRVFKSLYTLLPGGDYILHRDRLGLLLEAVKPRTRKEPIAQEHKDFAASLQETLEEIVLHILGHYQKETGHRKLCLAGGVAHNCSMNGKILYSGLFEDLFVQPAAHDAGCAIGAALEVQRKNGVGPRYSSFKHVYLGTNIGENERISETLAEWDSLLEYETAEDIAEYTADLLANGAIVGWVQGRSEFGPRALGNRSILADPRPAKNKDIVNAMVKKREAFRPFAPSVIEERVEEYFDLPRGKMQLPFMIFVVRVRQDKQDLLGAVTHVDGTARVHTVSRDVNERFWQLINAFGRRTDVSILLNTSFNNNVEPIVDSAEDAIVCFLTTKLDYLVVGNHVVKRKKDQDSSACLTLVLSLPLHVRIHSHRRFTSATEIETAFEIGNSYDDQSIVLSPDVFRILSSADGRRSIDELMDESGIDSQKTKALAEEFQKLWSKRVIRLRPKRR
jgi:carbamoyltransferase